MAVVEYGRALRGLFQNPLKVLFKFRARMSTGNDIAIHNCLPLIHFDEKQSLWFLYASICLPVLLLCHSYLFNSPSPFLSDFFLLLKASLQKAKVVQSIGNLYNHHS